MDENNTQQPVQPDMTGNYGQQPVQPDMTGNYGQQPVQPDMTGNYGQQPVQPDMAGYYGQQPVQPDMTGNYGQQPVQPDMAGNYGQQPVQPNMAGYYGQQPGTPQPGTGNGKKPKKPMTKGRLAAWIGGGVAIIALVVCGVIFLPRIFKSDKEVVLDAIEETIESYGSEDAINDLVGYDEIMKKYRENGGNKSFSMSIAPGEGSEYNVGITIDGAIDQKKKKLSGTFTSNVGDSELVSADVYADEEKIYASVPELVDGYLAYSAKNPLGTIADSPIGDALGLDAASFPNTDVELFASDNGGSGVAGGYVSALETIWDAAKFEKQGRAKITVNGETVTAKEYYVTWAKEDLQDACVAALDGLAEAVKESGSSLEESGISEDDFDQYIEQAKQLVPSIIKDDLQIKVYIKGKRAVKMTCKDQVNLMGMVKIDYDFWLDAGENDLSGNLSFDVSGTSAGIKFESHDVKKNAHGTVTLFYGDTEIPLEFSKEITESGDVRTTTSKISATDYISAEWVKTFNKADNTFEGKASADIVGADVYSIAYNGAWKDIKKGEAYTVSIDSIDVKVADKTVCSGAISESVDTSKIDVKAKDESLTVYDFETMTEDDLKQLTDQNKERIDAWTKRVSEDTHIKAFIDAISDLLGNSPTPIEDMEEEPDDSTSGDADTEKHTMENTVLQPYDESVGYKIKGCIDGFKFNYANEYTMDFTSDSYSYLDYRVLTASSLEEALDASFSSMSEIDGVEMKDSQEKQTTQIDGKDVLYNIESYTAYENNCTDVTAVVEVEPGVFLSVYASIYTDDESYTTEQVLQALSSKYYEKVK